MNKDAPYSKSVTNPAPGNNNLMDSPTNPGAAYYKPTPDNEQGFLPPKVETQPEERMVEHGQSGTLIFTGFIAGEEYNSELTGRRGIAIYDQMRRSDATVQASLKVVKLPVLSAEYSIQSASDDPKDQEVANFVEENLFKCIDFTHFSREALTMLDFGFSIFEKLYKYDVRNGKEGIYLRKLAFRKQTTVFRWETMQATAGITQVTYNGGQFSIPEDMILRFTWEQEGDNYEGISMLRAAYKHWYYKDLYEKIWGIMIERQGVGIPQLTAPENADEPSKQQARSALRNLRANEQGYIEIPEGYVIDFMDMKGKTTADIAPAIDYHDKQIVMNVLAPFLKLGSGARGSGGGSHALSQDQSKLFEQNLEAIAKKLCEVINNDLIPQIVEMNFSGVTDYPTLEHGKIADDNIEVISEAMSKLTTAGLITPDPDLEQDIRDMLKTVDLPDAYRDDYNNRPRPQSSLIADPRDPATLDNDTKTKKPLPGEKVEAADIREDLIAFKDRLVKRIEAADGSGKS